jgi:superfamily I DNA and RNA helicase
VLPNALLEAVEKLGGQYDDILVDEAQDLESEWLMALTYTLRDVDQGSIWLFTDDNHRVYDAKLDVPPEYRPFDLTVNCRNTQAIHAQVIQLYRGEVLPKVEGPPGRQPELINSKNEPSTIEAVLDRLCGEQDVRPRDVVVLSGHGRENSGVYGKGAGRWTYTDKRGRGGGQVFFSSIRGFKGLESPVVILCELDNLDAESRDSQLYVGLSRARNHCVIVAPDPG